MSHTIAFFSHFETCCFQLYFIFMTITSVINGINPIENYLIACPMVLWWRQRVLLLKAAAKIECEEQKTMRNILKKFDHQGMWSFWTPDGWIRAIWMVRELRDSQRFSWVIHFDRQLWAKLTVRRWYRERLSQDDLQRWMCKLNMRSFEVKTIWWCGMITFWFQRIYNRCTEKHKKLAYLLNEKLRLVFELMIFRIDRICDLIGR